MSNSISSHVRKFLSSNPAIRECLGRGLINYSALAREICKLERLSNISGASIACRRAAAHIKGSGISHSKVNAVLAHAHISLVSQINVSVIGKPIAPQELAELQVAIRELRGEFNLIEGRELVTIIYSSRFENLIASKFSGKVVRKTSDLAQIAIVFDEKFETTSGVVSHIYSQLAASDINIYEELSCYSDLLLIVSEKDSKKAISILSIP